MTNLNILPPPERVDPARLTVLLEDAGWELAGGRQGQYNRLTPPSGAYKSGNQHSLIVPLDKTAPDYTELMVSALRDVTAAASSDLWKLVEARLLTESADQFQFRKESNAPPGLIPWREGEQFIAAARATLSAGARTFAEKAKRYNNRLGQFSSRYLNTVLMGQTAVGSYIVTAYAPTDALVALPAASSGQGQMPDEVHGRDITTAVATALNAALEGIEHYRQSSTPAGFIDGVRNGMSYDLSEALISLVDGSDGGDITIAWESSAHMLGGPMPSSTFEFSGDDIRALSSASSALAGQDEAPQREAFVGRVHLLTRRHAGGPGVFGIETLIAPSRKFRVRLQDPEQYHLAVRAHEEDVAIVVEGRPERDGSVAWLYNAEIQGELGTVEELAARPIRRDGNSDNQLEIDFGDFSGPTAD